MSRLKREFEAGVDIGEPVARRLPPVWPENGNQLLNSGISPYLGEPGVNALASVRQMTLRALAGGGGLTIGGVSKFEGSRQQFFAPGAGGDAHCPVHSGFGRYIATSAGTSVDRHSRMFCGESLPFFMVNLPCCGGVVPGAFGIDV